MAVQNPAEGNRRLAVISMLRHFFLFLSRQRKLERWLLRVPGARRLAGQFVAGETLPEAMAAVGQLIAAGRLATLDHLGENVRSAEQARAAMDAYREMLEEIARQRLRWGVSVKLTQLGLDLSEELCRSHLRLLVERAEQCGSFVRVDMESSAYTDRTLALVTELRRNYAAIGAVIQAYLYRSEQDVRRLLEQGTKVRLCKGAYNEPPTIAYPRKADVDASFVRLMQMLLASGIYHGIATHDPRMIEATCRTAGEIGLAQDGFEFQMLYGIRRDLQQQLVERGYRLRLYVPFGKEWFPYFMRRLAERPANVLFVLKGLAR
jgi:proline dehydrogenase